MKKKLLSIPILLALAMLGTTIAQAQQWPGKGPGPYAPNGAGQYGAGNPYTQQLNELAVKDPVKHEGCYTQANEKNLRQESRWKFMLECMKK